MPPPVMEGALLRLGLDEVFIHWVSTLGICLCFHTAAIYAGCNILISKEVLLRFGSTYLHLTRAHTVFAGINTRPTLRVALTGASLPAAPRFLGRHFSRAKTPQDFSARENQVMTRKRTPAYWRMLLRGPRKVVRSRGERRSDEALEGCLFRRNSAPT